MSKTLTHQLEEIIGTVKRGKILTPQLLNCLYQGLEAIDKIATEAVTGKPAQVSVFHVLAQLMGADTGEELPEIVANDLPKIEPELPKTQPIPAEVFAPINDYQIDTIRVDSQKLDKLLTQASELIVTKGHYCQPSCRN